MVQNRQKVKVDPFTFWGAFFQSQCSRQLYVQWSSNQAKNAFNDQKKLFKAFLTNLKNRQKVKRGLFSIPFFREFDVQWSLESAQNAF